MSFYSPVVMVKYPDKDKRKGILGLTVPGGRSPSIMETNVAAGKEGMVASI